MEFNPEIMNDNVVQYAMCNAGQKISCMVAHYLNINNNHDAQAIYGDS